MRLFKKLFGKKKPKKKVKQEPSDNYQNPYYDIEHIRQLHHQRMRQHMKDGLMYYDTNTTRTQIPDPSPEPVLYFIGFTLYNYVDLTIFNSFITFLKRKDNIKTNVLCIPDLLKHKNFEIHEGDLVIVSHSNPDLISDEAVLKFISNNPPELKVQLFFDPENIYINVIRSTAGVISGGAKHKINSFVSETRNVQEVHLSSLNSNAVKDILPEVLKAINNNIKTPGCLTSNS